MLTGHYHGGRKRPSKRQVKPNKSSKRQSATPNGSVDNFGGLVPRLVSQRTLRSQKRSQDAVSSAQDAFFTSQSPKRRVTIEKKTSRAKMTESKYLRSLATIKTTTSTATKTATTAATAAATTTATATDPVAPSSSPPPSFLDDYLQWDMADTSAAAPAQPQNLLLVHTQPMHLISTSRLQDRFEELESRSLSPSFSAFSDHLHDSVPEFGPVDTSFVDPASKIPRNPPFQVQHLIDAATQLVKPKNCVHVQAPPVYLSPEESFVQYISHKLSRYCGYLPNDSKYYDKLRLQEISYRLGKTTF
ncbi:LANO_0H10990g1_1 [Lachancea nothofagi CBS 11611]|uniref:LANO_0H10990g1_1 n=1 Tax=Lachancea nothofagi CBS 11611 TaxID=1266666 RepID=A0A1G4KM55_9SACH|nr:LANO_0H10990g1_1 [Lachancea nothofagi CBS 11611]